MNRRLCGVCGLWCIGTPLTEWEAPVAPIRESSALIASLMLLSYKGLSLKDEVTSNQ